MFEVKSNANLISNIEFLKFASEVSELPFQIEVTGARQISNDFVISFDTGVYGLLNEEQNDVYQAMNSLSSTLAYAPAALQATHESVSKLLAEVK